MKKFFAGLIGVAIAIGVGYFSIELFTTLLPQENDEGSMQQNDPGDLFDSPSSLSSESMNSSSSSKETSVLLEEAATVPAGASSSAK